MDFYFVEADLQLSGPMTLSEALAFNMAFPCGKIIHCHIDSTALIAASLSSSLVSLQVAQESMQTQTQPLPQQT